MNLQTKNCDARRLMRFLRHELEPEEQDALADHLNHCAKCSAELEALTAKPQWWQAVGESLRDGRYELQPLSELVFEPRGEDHGESPKAEIKHVLDRLAPTDDPQSLGRIGGYEVVGVVGSGGMGVVLKAFDTALNRYVAIKTLSPHLASSGAARQRFAREAQAAAAVVHENVSEIYGVHETGGLPYLVMPYLRGTSLQRRLDDQGPMNVAEVLRIALQTANGLAAAHAQGLVHRDVKPANVLLAEGVERVKIIDFGLARAADDASLTRTGVIVGTPQYVSPEQALGEPVDHRSDLFSLGSVMYATCTGHPPFRAESSYGILRRITDTEPRPIREINPEIPPWLCRLIARLHAKRPDDRFQSAEEVAELLEQCLAHVQTSGKPLPEVLKEPVKQTFSRKHAGTIALMATIITAMGSSLLWMNRDNQTTPEQTSPAQPSEASAAEPQAIDESPSDKFATDWNATAEQLESLSRDAEAFESRVDQLWDRQPLAERETKAAPSLSDLSEKEPSP